MSLTPELEPTFRSVPAAAELFEAGRKVTVERRIEQLNREKEEAVARGDFDTAAAKFDEAKSLKLQQEQRQ